MKFKRALTLVLSCVALFSLAMGCERAPGGETTGTEGDSFGVSTETEQSPADTTGLTLEIPTQPWETPVIPGTMGVTGSWGTHGTDGTTTDPGQTEPPIIEPVKEGSVFTLSKTGKNVVVIMLDRAMNEYIPYIFKEKPELLETFDGFTYYNNVISHGGYTNFGVPPLMGGYEYTPVEMNKRDNELLVDKHNEALKVMPVLFSGQGYEVTVCDPVYAGYQWVSDLSIFDGYPGISAYNLKGLISSEGSSTPGVSKAFLESYAIMERLGDLTNITSTRKNTFLFLSNDMTHEPVLLQAPHYTPATHVDNSAYDASCPDDRFTVNGIELKVDTDWKMSHYHVNMSALLRLGEWFDYLRAEGVYDNTRIILVADHGRHLAQIDRLVMGGADTLMDVELYYPLLMVKDFGATGFQTDGTFMTTADVPTLATDGLIENPINPFTGKPISDREKYTHDQLVIVSNDWNVDGNNGYTFKNAWWASVKDNLWVRDNWVFTEDRYVLKEHRLP